MQVSNLIVRYASHLVGLVFTLVNLFFITYYLDLNEFAVWGISLSLIYVFSQISQLTFVQLIEKYFATFTQEEILKKLYQITKLILYISPILYIILALLDSFGFFKKYEIENIYILFVLITISSVLESLIEIFSKFMLVYNQSKKLDIREFLILKLIRTISFFLLLYFEYSIFHLLAVSILLRSVFLISLIKILEKNVINILKKILTSKIKIDLFDKFRYTILAFLIKSLQVSFLNIAFLLYTEVKDKNIAAFALCVLIINNLQPISASLTTLLFPSIAMMADKNKVENNFLISSTFITTFISSFLITGILILIEFKGLYSIYFEKYDNSIYKLITFSVFAATINPIFYPLFLYLKFIGKELTLLLNVLFSFLISILLVLFTDTNLIICYVIFEVFILIFTTVVHKKIKTNSKIYLISVCYLITSIFLIIEFYGYDLYHKPLIFSLPFLYIVDYYIYKLKRVEITSVFNLNMDEI